MRTPSLVFHRVRIHRIAALLLAAACGAGQEGTHGVARYDRPPGMPIGTGATGGELEEPSAKTDNGDLPIQ